MKVSLNEKTLSSVLIYSFQLIGGWDSLYNKGRLLLDASELGANSVASSNNFFVGADVTFEFDGDLEVFFKVLSFNFLQSDPNDSGSTGEFLELILISPWYFDDIKSTAHFGSTSEILSAIVDNSSTTFEDSDIENTADPSRRRYQLGVNNWTFLETLRPYASGNKSHLYLFSKLFGTSINLKNHSTLKDATSIARIQAAGSSNSIGSKSQIASEVLYKYNEVKRVSEIYSETEITKEIQLTELSELDNSIINELEGNSFPSQLTNYTNRVHFSKYDHSPLEQRILALRKKFLETAESNSVEIKTMTLALGIDLGDKITLAMDKNNEFHNKLISVDCLIKGIILSYDSEDDDNTYTKILGIPLLKLD